MSWLLFLDEIGHDHKNTPYEVRGGVALQDARLWPFVQAMQRLELDCFGCQLHQYRTEIKGCKLLDKDRFRWAGQADALLPESRRKHTRGFLTKGLEKKPPTAEEFTAYGQASLEMARGVFQLLRDHQAVLLATAIPQGDHKPEDPQIDEFLRKDHVFLLERFFYFLEARQECGLLVMDEADKALDRKFVRQMEAYFTRTATGRYRTQWIIPTPLLVSSDMTAAIQARISAFIASTGAFGCRRKGWMRPSATRSPTNLAGGWIAFSLRATVTKTARSSERGGLRLFQIPTRAAAHEKGGNAFEVTRKQLLGRTSVDSIGRRRAVVKSIFRSLIARPVPRTGLAAAVIRRSWVAHPPGSNLT